MKKLMFAAVAAAGFASIGYSDVESANVVGYVNTVSMEANRWYICGLNFENIGAADQQFAVADLITDKTIVSGTLTAGKTPADSTVIQIRDAATDETINYFWNAEAIFELDPITWLPVYTPGWTRGGKTGVTTDRFPVGTGFWVKNPGSALQFTFAGQVAAADETEITAGVLWKLAANPYPIALNLTENIVAPGMTAGKTPADSTVIQIRDVATDETINYFWNAEAIFELDPITWLPVYTPGWTRGGKTGVTTDTIAPGIGFWIKNPGGDIKVTFVK